MAGANCHLSRVWWAGGPIQYCTMSMYNKHVSINKPLKPLSSLTFKSVSGNKQTHWRVSEKLVTGQWIMRRWSELKVARQVGIAIIVPEDHMVWNPIRKSSQSPLGTGTCLYKLYIGPMLFHALANFVLESHIGLMNKQCWALGELDFGQATPRGYFRHIVRKTNCTEKRQQEEDETDCTNWFRVDTLFNPLKTLNHWR